MGSFVTTLIMASPTDMLTPIDKDVYKRQIQNIAEAFKKVPCNNRSQSWQTLVETSPYSPEVRSALLTLFHCVEKFDEEAINRQFHSAIATIARCEEELRTKTMRFMPLYRKVGLLGGIALAILLA